MDDPIAILRAKIADWFAGTDQFLEVELGTITPEEFYDLLSADFSAENIAIAAIDEVTYRLIRVPPEDYPPGEKASLAGAQFKAVQ